MGTRIVGSSTKKPKQSGRPARASALVRSSSRVAVLTRPREKPLMNRKQASKRSLVCAGLFAGIGGIEHGLHRHGHKTHFLCENEPSAIEVLKERFEGVRLWKDVRELKQLPSGTELLTAGFPCQDLSQAGMTRGIGGSRSGLILKVFDLLEARRSRVPFVLLENVPFMLQLGAGRALEVIISRLESLGYRWAYRVVDSRAFGLPQRRERVFLLASRDEDPARVLFADEAGAPEETSISLRRANGFYWTEGLRGLGWANDAVPTLKGGSTIGIPSPPAILFPNGEIVKPDIRDAERMQGFAVNWTKPAERVVKPGFRWKLVGNAVTVDVAAWVGRRLVNPADPVIGPGAPVRSGRSWPRAAMGASGKRFEVTISAWPVRESRPSLGEFLKFPTTPLSVKAIAGFQSRIQKSTLRFPAGFREAVATYLARATSQSKLAV